MEIVLLVVAIVVAVAVLARSPMSRALGRGHEDEANAMARGAHVDHQFKRPRNEGDLF
jgi:hypothetical protein